MTDDEIDPIALEHALRAPGTPAELASEESYRAMFREARAEAPPMAAVAPARTGRTTARRLGTSSTLAVVFAAAGGGVAAAAYTTHLPDPVQQAVHSVLAPLGVPQAESQRPVDRVQERRTPETLPETDPTPAAPGSATPAPSPSGTSTPSPSATPDAPRPSSTPKAPAVPVPSPSSRPSDSPTSAPPSPVSSPAATAVPPPKPAHVTIGGASQQVAPGATTLISGQVTAADGTPVADRQVVLQQRGPGGWRRVAVSRTSSDGSVSVTTGAAQRTTAYRLRAGRAHSATWRLVLQPTLTASAQTTGRSSVVTVTAAGGQAGDQVRLLTRRNGTLVQEGRATLDGGGQAVIQLNAPKRDRVYVVQLTATRAHAGTRVQVRVSRPAGKRAGVDESAPPDQS